MLDVRNFRKYTVKEPLRNDEVQGHYTFRAMRGRSRRWKMSPGRSPAVHD